MDDIETIKKVLDGDKNCYRELVEKYHKPLIRFIYNMVRDQTLAEDIAQETFLKAFTKLSSYDSKYSFSTWIYTIAMNLAKNQIKAKRPFSQLNDQLVGSNDNPLEKKQLIQSAIEKLQPNYKQVINLFYWEEKSYDEIAVIMGHPIGTIRTWLSRSKQELEGLLNGQF